MTDRKFGINEIVMCDHRIRVRILDYMQDDAGNWLYTVEPTDWEVIGDVNRTVPERLLAKI